MELLSNTPVHHAVPDEYVFPPGKRPANDELVDPTITLPVIDLADTRRGHVVGQIIRAGEEFGFFQVVNHGVREEVVRGFRDAAAEFFALPPEEKLPYYSEDQSRPFLVASSTTYDRGATRYWRDYLKLQCFPVDRFAGHWPARPGNFRESLAEYIVQVQELAAALLGLIAEGLGLDESFFAGALSGGETQMNVNWYPPCPDPSVTLGLLPHCDRHLLTVLSQGDVSGLQAKHRGRWIAVQPVPNAFVINFGHQMEIVTNGLLKSVEHRAVTNSAVARMSVATLIMPEMECRIAPAPELVGLGNRGALPSTGPSSSGSSWRPTPPPPPVGRTCSTASGSVHQSRNQARSSDRVLVCFPASSHRVLTKQSCQTSCVVCCSVVSTMLAWSQNK